ncbi:VanZ family protein [Kistimonas asteriae]|uniref:VanZ family protein n=1 Tax=Kistimonas asteriae TaxID=517724 RepID=UPI001BAB986E|nr:hypothetical protein [Kistimonas asteriae]
MTDSSQHRVGGGIDRNNRRVVMARCLLLVVLPVIGWLATFSPWQPFMQFSDKLRHIAAFLVLTGLIWQSWPAVPVHRRLLLMVALGLGLELVQTLTPTREFHLDDLAASVMGAVVFEALRESYRRIHTLLISPPSR